MITIPLYDSRNLSINTNFFQLNNLDLRRHDWIPEHREELGHQRAEVQEGLQRGADRRGDQSVAVHHPHEENLPH